MADLEIWQNVSRARRGISRIDQFGKKRTELVNPGRNVSISREERLAYQREVAVDSFDIFSNGAMVPVKLIDEDDIMEVKNNPNLRSESELEDLFKLHWKKFEQEIARISNVPALERLAAMAEDSETISVKKYTVVADRLKEMKDVAANTSQVSKSLIQGAQRAEKTYARI